MATDDDLRQRVEALQRDLWKSAEIGKSLLAENEELHGQLEALRRQHASQIESLEQEKHVLTMKLTNAAHMESTYCEEIENLRETMLRQRAAADHEAESRHAAEVLQLQAKLADASGRIKELEAAERAATDDKVTLEARLAAAMDLRWHDSRGGCRGAAGLVDESAVVRATTEEEDDDAAELELRQQLDEAIRCKVKLQEDAEQAASRALAAEALARRQAEQCAALREDVEDAQSQASSFCCALEKLRLENQDLRAELDMVKLLSQDHKAKGNSMFAELEDKRIEAERRIVSLLVDNKSLVAQCDQYQKQLRSLKAQMASVLQLSTGSVDAEHVRQLEQRLADATARTEELTRTLQRYESGEADEASQKLSLVAAACAATASSSAGVAAAYIAASSSDAAAAAVVDIGYAQSLLKSKDAQLDRLRSELQLKRYELLAESSRLQESQRRERESDGLVAKLRAENMQLTVRLEDLAAAAATTAPPARSSGRTIASAGGAAGAAPTASAQQGCNADGARRPPSALPAARQAMPASQQQGEPCPASAAAAVRAAAQPRPPLSGSCAAASSSSAACLSCPAEAAATSTSGDAPVEAQRERSSRCAGDRHSAAVANPRTAARLAKAEQRAHRRPPPAGEASACLQPKLTARASATASETAADGATAAGPSQKRRSLRTEGPMREVCGNIPWSEEVTAEGAKVTELEQPSGVPALPQRHNAGSSIDGEQENCSTQ